MCLLQFHATGTAGAAPGVSLEQGGRGKIYVHNNLCTLENHEKANRIIIISGTIICEGSKFFPYLQFGILSSGSHEKIHNICINVIIKLHFVFADILDV